ncbi:MAG: hypothetical protein R3D25_16485 [Geminicoccaceae bacterium]
MLVDVPRDQNAAGCGQRFQACGDVHAVAVDVVVVVDDVAEIDADAEPEALALGQMALARLEVALDGDGAIHGTDDARELDQRAVAHQLDDVAAMRLHGRLDHGGAQRPEAGMRAPLVGRHQPTVADHVGGENRREPPFDRRTRHAVPLPEGPMTVAHGSHVREHGPPAPRPLRVRRVMGICPHHARGRLPLHECPPRRPVADRAL